MLPKAVEPLQFESLPQVSLETGNGKTKSVAPLHKLTDADLNPFILNAKYAVRGRIPMEAEKLKHQLVEHPGSLPFDKIINANIGNPQQLDQKPLTFYRRVLSVLEDPELIETAEIASIFPADVISRAKELLKSIGSIGAYSHSQGVKIVRDAVANYITRRDGFPADADDIFLTAGASTAVSYLLELLATGPETGFLIPIPQYPLYTATIAMNNATAVPYYLNEDDDWSIDPTELVRVIENSIAEGVIPRCLVLINPGNPTGAILKEDDIAELLGVAAKYSIFVIADEVYQENVYRGEFVSVKKVLRKLQSSDKSGYYDDVQLASLHSTSKGLTGECGQRGGYMELIGLDPSVRAQINKLASISLCGPVTAQALVSLMVNPPKPGDASYPLDHQQREKVYGDLLKRAHLLFSSFNEMEGVSCQNPMGAMYCFPRFDLPEKAVLESQRAGVAPDVFYCEQLLLHTGICTVPGSGFGQVEGTYHVRTTFLAPGTDWIEQWKTFHAEFMATYR
ncbi:DEKNAAC104848 [Brettanomyces naardenensis]|uniref:Glutamate pyruvate transaminase n=1 Tax=Brettanomyces naardenensis TaxID=13370 RepID=A0A448YS57_BRENA|nr:DEKNAAC104848 [Brettanomyces naardenensis]